MTSALATVVIVGRPNVGKSTLFNRFLGSQVAIVQDEPGVTRDRFERLVEWQGRQFNVVDTGGWMPGGSELDAKVSRQVEAAVRDADLVLFVVDATVGVLDDDQAIAKWLRTSGKEVLVVSNKVDSDKREFDKWEFLSLGLGDPYPVSALHGRKSGDILDEVLVRVPRREGDEVEVAKKKPAYTEVPRIPRVSIVGRPNVGKSTLFNRLVGHDRSVVHDMPGTTRDSIDTVVTTPDGPITFVDTAGMRRRSRVDDSTEYYSFVRGRCFEQMGDSQCRSTGRSRHRNRSQTFFRRRCACPENVGVDRQGRAEAAAGAARFDRAIPPPSPDARREQGHRSSPTATTGAERCARALCVAGRLGSADVHPLCQQRVALHLFALPRAGDTRGF